VIWYDTSISEDLDASEDGGSKSSETLVSYQITTGHQNPVHNDLHLHHHENLKSCISFVCLSSHKRKGCSCL